MLGITAHQQLCLAWEDDLGAAVTPQDPRGWAGGAAAIPPCRAPAQGSLDRTSPGPIALLPAASLCKYPAGLSRILLIRKKSTPRSCERPSNAVKDTRGTRGQLHGPHGAGKCSCRCRSLSLHIPAPCSEEQNLLALHLLETSSKSSGVRRYKNLMMRDKSG